MEALRIIGMDAHLFHGCDKGPAHMMNAALAVDTVRTIRGNVAFRIVGVIDGNRSPSLLIGLGGSQTKGLA